MRSPSWLAVLALPTFGCVDVHRCHDPVPWRVCDGETAQPGASGAPPSILALVLPTCANLDGPTVTGTLHVTDPDSDAQLVKLTVFSGARLSESEAALDDASRTTTDWEGTYALSLPTTQRREASYQLRLKVTDRAGNQSAPLCSTFTLLD
jgi:hypothetical protein